MNQAKVLIYDIETAPALGLFFGKPYDVNIAKIVQHEYVFGFAYKWSHEKRIRTCYIWDFPSFHKRIKPTSPTLAAFLKAEDVRLSAASKEVLAVWAQLATESNVLLGHNSDQFDYKQMHGRLMQYNLPPIPKPLFVDTKKAAKQLGYYPSNKLDDLVQRFGLGKKLPHNDYPNAIDLWWDCMNDITKAKKHMVAYNKVDVEVTERLYERFRPYMHNHPHMGNLTGQPDACKHCGKNEGFVGNGYDYTKTGKFRRFQCKACRGNNRSRKGEKQALDYV